MKKIVTLADGNGGEENRELIEKLLFNHLGNEILNRAEDASILSFDGKVALSTDSFTVSPLFFKGGDIGKLSVSGSCNDLAMMGAKPKYLTLALIIEEGMSYSTLEKIVKSIKREVEINGVKVVTGDTKVVPKGAVDKIFINTTGVGEVVFDGVSASNLQDGDSIVVSRDIGRHGASIFASREGIEFESELESDCDSLWQMVETLLEGGIRPKAMRDATRGGLSAVLNEWAVSSDVSIEIEEQKIPISKEVLGVCELLGFDATSLANEGTFLLAIDSSQADKALELLRRFEQNRDAQIVGRVKREVKERHRGRVILKSAWGTKRFLEPPVGELLPRIC
jgi:hydrogenase expression/formation protein HypE